VSNPLPASPPSLGTITRILVLTVAAIGFLFDTYELLMFPVIGRDSISELEFHKKFGELVPKEKAVVKQWGGRMLWIAALAGGAFGLLGGWLIDRLGRKTIMIASILAYSLSPIAASFSNELWQLILFRSTTFIGVCVEMVAAVTWLAELFEDKRTREMVIGWTLATASLGGILVTEIYNLIVEMAKTPGLLPSLPFPSGFIADNVAWRFTLLTGLVPGAAILLLMPFVPESQVWKQKKQTGTLKRPSFLELFSPQLLRTTVVTTVLSACGYAAAFGAIQQTPLNIVPGLPDIAAKTKKAKEGLADAQAKVEAAKDGTSEQKAEAKDLLVNAKQAQLEADQAVTARNGNIQRWQELGGLAGRIVLAMLLLFVPSRTLIRLFLIPGVILMPLTFYYFVGLDYAIFATAIFFCGFLTVAQFSFMSEYLPKVFPLHLRGTGGSFATNFGGRMIGTMAATLNTEYLSSLFPESLTPPLQVAAAAAVIGGSVYAIALVASFFLPAPQEGSQP
jgi:MFS family permease